MAAEMLKAVGFVHLYSSRVSIASYYAWPGWEKRAALRIADHKYGGPRRENCFVPMASAITFHAQNFKADAAGIRHVPREHITRDVARGIGMYFLRANGVLSSGRLVIPVWQPGVSVVEPQRSRQTESDPTQKDDCVVHHDATNSVAPRAVSSSI